MSFGDGLSLFALEGSTGYGEGSPADSSSLWILWKNAISRTASTNPARWPKCAATHGLFIGTASEIVADPLFDGFVVTDIVPPFRLEGSGALSKLTVLDSTQLIADAIIDNRMF